MILPRTNLNLQGTKALVVGLGDTGAACVRWLQAEGAEVRATDSRANPPHADVLAAEKVILGEFKAADFHWADLIVVSPGVAVKTPEIYAAQLAGKDIVGDIELLARVIAGDGSQVIAITGSNGKSTVTSLAGHLCTTAGKKTVVAGNIGQPVLDVLLSGARPEVWVLELSSFQLETTHSLQPAVATVLNLSEDHLDRYEGMAGYAAAKARIFAKAKLQIVNREDRAAAALARADIPTRSFGLLSDATEYGLVMRDGQRWLAEGDKPLVPVSALPIAGLHNAANALAALALCRGIGLEYGALLPGLQSFRGLPHRVEKVAEHNGVTWYDDSKGTNVGATEAALRGFTSPIILIAGGDGKGQDFAPLRAAAHNTRAVLLIGRDARLIAAALGPRINVIQCEILERAVAQAAELAQPGDVVLLSPACASWDQFRNYVHRAEVFRAAVDQLAVQEAAHVL